MENEELLQEEETSILTLTDENGEETEFEYLDCIEYEGKEYLVLLPMEDDQIVILEVEPVDEEKENYLAVEDEKPLNAVYGIFKEKYKDILTFEDKYMSGGKSGSKGGAKSAGMADLKRRCPAELPDGMTERVQELAVATFKALGCLGVARIDFMIDESDGKIYVNEINTIPGSLSFYLWEPSGIPYSELLGEMVDLALKRSRERKRLSFSHDTNLLSANALSGLKGAKGVKKST